MCHIAMIWAQAANGVIGQNNQLPWHLPEDFKFFKSITLGKPVIMGRKTYESIGKALPGRINIVISRDPNFTAPDAQCFSSLAAGVDYACGQALSQGGDEVMVMGGAQIYAAMMAKADRLYVTHVDAELEGDAFAPTISSDFELRLEQRHAADARHAFAYRFATYLRRR